MYTSLLIFLLFLLSISANFEIFFIFHFLPLFHLLTFLYSSRLYHLWDFYSLQWNYFVKISYLLYCCLFIIHIHVQFIVYLLYIYIFAYRLRTHFLLCIFVSWISFVFYFFTFSVLPSKLFAASLTHYNTLRISLQNFTRCKISIIDIFSRLFFWHFSQLPEFSRAQLIATGDIRFFYSRMHPRPRYIVTIRTLICVSSRSAYPRSDVLFYCVLLRFESFACLWRIFSKFLNYSRGVLFRVNRHKERRVSGY